ncbi:MAG: SRPBCC domain-containing protein, partial [Alphaproteobacteria bacterium]|nr:SRPBCC domain-containing protein [Alphaproteobacteria bacterium]
MAKAATQETPFTFHIERVFDAPRERVWKAWTDPEQFRQWFGPKHCEMLYAKMDLRPGGEVTYGMDFGKARMYGKWAFREIVAPEKLVAIVSFTDETGEKIVVHPFMENWPLQILSVVTFTDMGDKTKISIAWTAYEASEIEKRAFEE